MRADSYQATLPHNLTPRSCHAWANPDPSPIRDIPRFCLDTCLPRRPLKNRTRHRRPPHVSQSQASGRFAQENKRQSRRARPHQASRLTPRHAALPWQDARPPSVALGSLYPCCVRAPATSRERPSKPGRKDRASGRALQSSLLPCAVPPECRQPRSYASCAQPRIAPTSRLAHWPRSRMGFLRTPHCRSRQRCWCARRPTATFPRPLSPPCSRPTVAARSQPQPKRWPTTFAPRSSPCAAPPPTDAVDRDDRGAAGRLTIRTATPVLQTSTRTMLSPHARRPPH